MQTTPYHTNRGIKTFFSSRTEALTGVLLAQLPDAEERRANPFRCTHIVVPNSGMKRYLELSIAEHFGICSHINIGFASRFLAGCYRQVLPQEQRQKYISTRQLTFAILSLWQQNHGQLPDTLQDTPLPELLKHHHTDKQRYHLAQQVAGLLNQYLNERPELIQAWQSGQNCYQHPHEDWQLALFRQLRLGQFAGNDLQQRFHAALSDTTVDLPRLHLPAVHLFGFHAIPPVQLADFSALAGRTGVNAYIFNPSIHYWRDIVPEAIKLEKSFNAEEEALMTTGNPLLAAWGQSGKYLLQALNDGPIVPINVDEHYQNTTDSVLTWLQNEVRACNEVADSQSLQEWADKEIKTGQFSLSLHLAASPRREVEILYDNLCRQFDKGALTPSDVLVMVPNLRDYAPHIEAVFGSQPQQSLPFSLANQTAAEADPETQTFLALLKVIDSDFAAQALFDVISERALRRQFQLSANDVQTIHYWLNESRTAKSFYDDSGGRSGSLEKLLDALLLAMVGGADCRVDSADFSRFALAAYQSGQRETLVGFARILQVFAKFSRLKTQQQTLTAWRDTLLALANDFLGPENALMLRLRQWHDEVFADTLPGNLAADELFAYDTVIADVTALLAGDELHGPFLSSGISFCAMVPMRSIPAKMICLLGLKQTFPPVVGKNPLDLRQARPLWSDRNINKEYRYFFLETLMAARQQLYLSYVGKDDKNGQRMAPSVLLENLLGFIQRYHPDYVKAIQRDYPLQGFLSNQTPTYQALFVAPEKPPAAVVEPIQPPTLPVQLNGRQLARYLAEPMQFYLSRYLSATPIALPDSALTEHHTVAVENGLDKWYFNQAGLKQQLFHQDERQSLIQQNRYPPAAISQTLLQRADKYVQPLSDALSDFVPGSQTKSQFVPYADGEQVLSLLWECPHYSDKGQWAYYTSALDGKKMLRHWVNHVLMNRVQDLPDYRSHLFTMDKIGRREVVTHITLLPLDDARKALQQLLALLQQCFFTPTAVSLQLAAKSARQVLSYKDMDYPLYPRLMPLARTAADSDLQHSLAVIDASLQASYRREES